MPDAPTEATGAEAPAAKLVEAAGLVAAAIPLAAAASSPLTPLSIVVAVLPVDFMTDDNDDMVDMIELKPYSGMTIGDISDANEVNHDRYDGGEDAAMRAVATRRVGRQSVRSGRRSCSLRLAGRLTVGRLNCRDLCSPVEI
ncbi:hypothetical protein [Mycobacterium szulgai]|uniref:hypothetical protein n=1 Tax=Mycobacterium szulgai TaxID=1787 RepID=UPI0021F2D4FA|nr:hypothetical protein [Mycobacterium szulgai]